jgi:hypothetical protein
MKPAIELTKEEKAKFREVLEQHFSSLSSNADLDEGETVRVLRGLHATLCVPATIVTVRDPNAPVLLTVSSTDRDDDGHVYVRLVVTKTDEETAYDRSLRLAREEVKRHGELPEESNPLAQETLIELQLAVTFDDVEVI